MKCIFLSRSCREANYLTENIRTFLISPKRMMLLVLNRSDSANVLYNKGKNISIAFYLDLYGMVFSQYKMGNEAEFVP